MSSAFKLGELSVSIFGESHGKAIGVVIDGLPGGFKVDFDAVLEFMARRAPKKDGTSTMRSEKDFPNVVSGMVDGVLTGTPLCAVINNTDQHSADYKSVSHMARPGHADYTSRVKYGNIETGGGRWSGRMTAPLCIAGGIVMQFMEKQGISISAHISELGGIKDDPLGEIHSEFPVVSREKGELMIAEIAKVRAEGDSIGGEIECVIKGVPAGIGDALFGGMESRIS